MNVEVVATRNMKALVPPGTGSKGGAGKSTCYLQALVSVLESADAEVGRGPPESAMAAEQQALRPVT